MTAKEFLLSKLTLAGVPTVAALAALAVFLFQECPPSDTGPAVWLWTSDSTAEVKNIPPHDGVVTTIAKLNTKGLITEVSTPAYCYNAGPRMFFWVGTDSLALWFPFFEGNGTKTEDLVGGYTATLYGAKWNQGRAISCLYFDGADDIVLVDKSFDVAGEALSVSAWIYPMVGAIPDARIVSKATGVQEQEHWWMLSLFESSRLRARLKTSNGGTITLYSAAGVIVQDMWQHVQMVYNGRTLKLYVNGLQVASIAKTGVIATDPTVPIGIGNHPTGTRPFRGKIEDVRIAVRKTPAAAPGRDWTAP